MFKFRYTQMEQERACENPKCGMTKTSTWRKGWFVRDKATGQRRRCTLCNKCGLHYRKGHFCKYCWTLYRSRSEMEREGWTTCELCQTVFHRQCANERTTSLQSQHADQELSENISMGKICVDCIHARYSTSAVVSVENASEESISPTTTATPETSPTLRFAPMQHSSTHFPPPRLPSLSQLPLFPTQTQILPRNEHPSWNGEIPSPEYMEPPWQNTWFQSSSMLVSLNNHHTSKGQANQRGASHKETHRANDKEVNDGENPSPPPPSSSL